MEKSKLAVTSHDLISEFWMQWKKVYADESNITLWCFVIIVRILILSCERLSPVSVSTVSSSGKSETLANLPLAVCSLWCSREYVQLA